MRCTMIIGILALVTGNALGQTGADGQTSTTSQLTNQFDATNFYAEQQRETWRQHSEKLIAIDAAYREAVAELGRENAQRLQAISSRNAEAHKRLADQSLSASDRAAESQRIQSESRKEREELRLWYAERGEAIKVEHAENRAAQVELTNQLIDGIDQRRTATLQRLLNGPLPDGIGPGIDFSADSEGDAAAGEQKSSSTGRSLYYAHCEECHGSNPGTFTWRYDLYEAVIEDDAAYFLNRVRNGPGDMPDIEAIQELTDAQVFSIRDFVREIGDINSGAVVVDDEPTKMPDADGGSTVGSTGGPGSITTPAGLPPITPDSPLPGGNVPGGSEVVRDAQTQSFGTAELTCNVSAGAEVSWVAPYSWDTGWIPPGGDLDAAESAGEAWMLRLIVKLEDPTTTSSSGLPAPGWCTFTDGSLGNVAGANRQIVVFAHSTSRPVQKIEFTGGAVRVWRSNSTPADRGGRFAINVLRAAYGVYLPAGNFSGISNGQVSAQVERIDDRWSVNGSPAFVVVEN